MSMKRTKVSHLATALRVAALAAVLLLVAAQPTPAAERTEAALMDADRAFAVAAHKDGLDGWMSFFAEDAVKFVFQGDIPRGKEAVRANDAAIFANPDVILEWEPTDAGVWSDRGTGFTRGAYRVVSRGADGARTVVSTGVYLTIWRHENDAWKVILDTGQPDAPAPGHAAGDHAPHDAGDH